MITHGPVGRLVKGHILDVSVKPLQRALQDHDKQLYVTWNPKKLKGWGCWEIRRLPNTKTSVFKGEHEGQSIYQLESVEFDLVHHVIDAAFLNYDIVRKIKAMDTWGNKNWVADIETLEEEHKAEQKLKALETLKYAVRHEKGAMRDFYEMARSGINPAEVITSTKWTNK